MSVVATSAYSDEVLEEDKPVVTGSVVEDLFRQTVTTSAPLDRASRPDPDEPHGAERSLAGYQATRVTFFNERQDWLVQAYKQLSRLALLEDDWDTYGADAPGAEALANARSVLSTLAKLDLQPTSVDASAEGGVCLSFRAGDRYGDVECFNSGEVLAVTSAGGDETEVWRVADLDRDLRASLTKIRTFLGR